MNFEQKDIISIKPEYNFEGELLLMIRLTNLCDYNCNYCNLHDNTSKIIHESEKIIEVVENILISLPSSYKKIIYHLYGGEPTVYKYVKEFLLTVSELNEKYKKDFRIELKTNFSKSINFFLDIININKNIYISMSYQNHQRKDNLTDLKNKVIKFKNVINNIDIMLEEEENSKPNEIIEFANFVKDNNIPVQLNTIDNKDINELILYQDIISKFKCIDDRINVITKNSIENISVIELKSNFDNFFGYKCNVGLHQFIIDASSKLIKIFLCYSDNLKNTNLVWDNSMDYNYLQKRIKFFNKPNFCLHKKCLCEVYIEKNKGRYNGLN